MNAASSRQTRAASTAASRASVYVISPSGAVRDPAGIARARERLAALGFASRLDRAALSRVQRFAGSDDTRLAAFGRAAAQPAPIVMITRGGYGLTRLLPRMDWAGLAAAGKQWVGFSDFTAFHLAMLRHTGAITWAGPGLSEDFAADEPDEITLATFAEAMRGELEILGFAYRGPKEVDARGTLWGGNLALVCALLGTPHWPGVRGGILFLEDVGEAPYRIERMLTTLLHAGVLDAQKAILLGGFSGFSLTAHDAGFDLPGVVRWLRAQTRTPILTGLPFGHGATKLTLPHGARVGLATEGRTAYLVLPHRH